MTAKTSGRWIKVMAGMYKRLGSDGATPIATVCHCGTYWEIEVVPNGDPVRKIVRTTRTLAQGKTLAEIVYRDAMK